MENETDRPWTHSPLQRPDYFSVPSYSQTLEKVAIPDSTLSPPIHSISSFICFFFVIPPNPHPRKPRGTADWTGPLAVRARDRSWYLSYPVRQPPPLNRNAWLFPFNRITSIVRLWVYHLAVFFCLNCPSFSFPSSAFFWMKQGFFCCFYDSIFSLPMAYEL